MESTKIVQDQLTGLKQALEALESSMLKAEKDHAEIISKLPVAQQPACVNMLHYLALRSEDIRDLQDRLHIAGLSSLASSESHVHAQLHAMLERLGKEPSPSSSCTYQQAIKDITQKAAVLFGTKKEAATPYIMVTFDTDYADDYNLVTELLTSGMNVARINCAHDSEPVWQKMIDNIQKASLETGIPCKIYMDLAGPKIRTVLPNTDKGKIAITEGGKLLLVEADADIDKADPTPLVSCTLPGIIPQLKKGERVLFDDGIIECVVNLVEKGKAQLIIKRISSDKLTLKEAKGINFPYSKLIIPPLTDYDKACLPFICKHADLVGYSFVSSANDIAELQTLLAGSVDKKPFIILKIELPNAVKHLPALLIQGMHEKVFGVMIARGDLFIEIGAERMSEIQEEILWICEAAHVPIIWATQVLENLNKSGIATRSEITDATYSAQAECVMINKGKHTMQVITTLRNILHRSGGHHAKKRYIFRPLNIAKEYLKK